MVLSFTGNTFTEVAERLPYYLNVVRIPPDYMPTARRATRPVFSRVAACMR